MLAKSTKRHKAEAGKELVGDSRSVERFSNVLSGVVKLTKTLSDGRQQIVRLQFAPDQSRPCLAVDQAAHAARRAHLDDSRKRAFSSGCSPASAIGSSSSQPIARRRFAAPARWSCSRECHANWRLAAFSFLLEGMSETVGDRLKEIFEQGSLAGDNGDVHRHSRI
ncbi:hypothetical protein FJW07_25200 [Mesorhizobium sp. B3-1-9]|nr:hypothetical protein FJW07_25200 [Mesorhizobium sp. B3-1-9]